MPHANWSRRQFLAAASAAVAIPTIIPARAFGANGRVVTGHVGVGGQGVFNLKAFLKQENVDIGGLCDVDSAHLAAAAKLVKGKPFDAVGDYRRLLDRKDIDAIVVSTPDHWHGLTTIHACQAGKDVYCEKPLSLTVAEGRAMVDAARKTNRVVQTGSQQRSSPEFRKASELIRSDKLGTLSTIQIGLPKSNFVGPVVPDSTPPAELDYPTWLGPAPDRPYNANRVHYKFRFFWDYSGGQMTNWGAHHIDIAHWALRMDNSGPVSVEGTAEFDPEHKFEVTTRFRLTYTYPNGVTLLVGQDQPDIPGGLTFVGSAGKLMVNRGKIKSDPAAILDTPESEMAVRLEESRDHHGNFLDCVASRNRPICDVEVGHRSATACHLGNIVARLGRKVRWDPVTERIEGDEAASAMLSRPYKSPWTA